MPISSKSGSAQRGAWRKHRHPENDTHHVGVPKGHAPLSFEGDHTRLAAHEIRSHLAVLSGYLSMLEDGTIGSLPDHALPVVAEMRTKTRSIAQIVDDMLEDARHQDGNLHLARKVVDLNEVVEQAVSDAKVALPGDHELVSTTPPTPLTADIDPARVRTILRNLLDNAVKYSPEGGRIECRLERDGGNAVISVSDEGIGIRAQDAEEVFKRFGRGRGEAEDIPGIGLGLYICRTLARLHGGDVAVASRPGRGSEFVVTLPLLD